MLAGELALAGVDVAIVERRASQNSPGSRARVCIAHDPRCSTSVVSPIGSCRRGRRRRSRPSPQPPWTSATFSPPYGLALGQSQLRAHPGRRSTSLEVPIHRQNDVTGVRAGTATGVDVQLSDGTACGRTTSSGATEGAAWSAKAAGLEFLGWEPTTSTLIAEVQLAEEPKMGRPRHASVARFSKFGAWVVGAW